MPASEIASSAKESSITEMPAASEFLSPADVLQTTGIPGTAEVPQVLESLPVEITQSEEDLQPVEVLQTAGVFSEAERSVEASPGTLQRPVTVSLESLSPKGRLAVPPYPERARRLGYEGRVVLELTISTAGRVVEVRVLEADTPEILIESCRGTVLRRWRFIPPGREVITRKTFRFRLNG